MPNTSRSSNSIPLPIKPAKNVPKPISRANFASKKNNSTQTETVVLTKETLNLHTCSELAVKDGGMRKDYIKAVNYINSVHKFINEVAEKNALEKTNLFVLPTIPNFAPLFHILLGKRTVKHKPRCRKSKEKEKWDRQDNKPIMEKPPAPWIRTGEQPPPNHEWKPERNSKSGSNIPRITEGKRIFNTFSDCVTKPELKSVIAKNEGFNSEMQQQISYFLNTLKSDLEKAVNADDQMKKCKNIDLVQSKLNEFVSIYDLPAAAAKKPPVPPRDDDKCSVIPSGVETVETEKSKNNLTSMTRTSVLSESSDIHTDPDLDTYYRWR